MAGNENSGGYRPGAPQNNTGVSAVGGAGSKNGQPKRYIPGMKNLGSTGVETMAQQDAALMSSPQTVPTKASMGQSASMMKLRTLLDDTTNPLEPQSTGVDFGRGPNSNVLPVNINPDRRPIENQEIVKKYLPAFANAAKAPNAPDSFKSFVNYLVGQIDV
jgi:hypothetical protein